MDNISELPEKIFFGNSRKHVAELLGVDSLAELEFKSEIVLPPSLHKHIVEALIKTTTDKHEHWIEFDQEKGQATIRREGTGTGFDVQSGKASSGNRFDLLAKAYFGNPILVDFHTHPDVSAQDILAQNSLGLEKGSIHLNPEQAAKLLSISAHNFSRADLEVSEKYSRYIRSSLLATSERIIFIVNKNFTLPLMSDVQNAFEYGSAYSQLMRAEAEKLMSDPNYSPNVAEFTQKTNDLLRAYCDKNGFIAFASTDPKSSVLKRI